MNAYAKAIHKALMEALQEDEAVFLMGEDVGAMGGRYGTSQGFLKTFGEKRIIDTPLLEELFIGIGIGAANKGLKPIIEFLHSDFFAIAYDDLWRSGMWQDMHPVEKTDILIRSGFGGYQGKGPELSSAAVSFLCSVPNISVFAPAFAEDAYAIIKKSMQKGGIKLILEHKKLLTENFTPSPKLETNNIYKANVIGNISENTVDALFISYSYTSTLCMQVMNELQKKAKLALVDLKCLKPFDKDTLLAQAKRTENIIFVEETSHESGLKDQVESFLREHAPRNKFIGIGAKKVTPRFGPKEKMTLPSTEDIKSFTLGLVNVA